MEPRRDPNEEDVTQMAEESMAHLMQGSAQLGLPLTGEQCAQFALYYRELVTWNERLNLTAITGL